MPEYDRAAVRSGIRVDGGATVGLVVDVDHLGLGFDRQLIIENRSAADFKILTLADCEAFGDDAHGIFAGGQSGKAVLPDSVRSSALLGAWAAQLHERAGYGCAGGIGDGSAQARGGGLGLQRGRVDRARRGTARPKTVIATFS